MNYAGSSGPPTFIVPHLAQNQPQQMDHSRMNMVPHNISFSHPPPPMHPHPGQFPPNMKFVGQPLQPNVHAQSQYYPDERSMYYQPFPGQQMFTRPPPQHFTTPFIQPQSFDAVAEQIKNVTQQGPIYPTNENPSHGPAAAGPHPPIPAQNFQQMNHTIPQLAHQHMMPPNHQMHPAQHHYQRQHYSQNSTSRGQTPTTTASHSGSKRSSPQNAHQNDATTAAAQQQEDYTPPGTPQELTPVTDDQKQQYIAGIGQMDKGVEMMVNRFQNAHIDNCYEHKQDYSNEKGDVFDKMEFVNQNYQNQDSKDWQHNVRAGERTRTDPNYGGTFDAFNGRNDRQMRQPLPRQGRNQQNRSSQDVRYGNQQRTGGAGPQRFQQRGDGMQRFQEPIQQNQRGPQRPRQMSDQWRSNNSSFEPPTQPTQAPEPERVIECSYCRMLGKPIEEYKSHVIRGFDGKAICPEIQKLSCPNCNGTKENAHTEYFCPKIGKKGSDDLEKTAADLQSFLCRRNQQNAPAQNHQPPQPTQNQNYQQHGFYHGGGNRRH
ncbi:Nanos RNA binding domain protein [Aphelenchoides bicaudatus]|nr:Nanos RNA binding domain protein [Aphelenchoides bicaudatus]